MQENSQTDPGQVVKSMVVVVLVSLLVLLLFVSVFLFNCRCGYHYNCVCACSNCCLKLLVVLKFLSGGTD